MKLGRYHKELEFAAVSLTLLAACIVILSTAQTTVGTRILNVATSTFRYKTGAQDSLRSNMTETTVQSSRDVAASLEITVGPDALIGNGQDSAMVNAVVRDVWGNPVPDSVLVTFAATAGSFPGGNATTSAPTFSGVASVRLSSDIVLQQVVTARITATTMSVNKQPLTAEASVTFFPGAVQGRVVSVSTGQGVQGVVVATYDQSNAERMRDTTNARGDYLIPLPTAGTYTSTITYVNRFGDAVAATSRIFLPIPAQGGIPPTRTLNAIAGSLIDPGTGYPLRQAGISLCLLQAGDVRSLGGRALPVFGATDERGVFLFDSLNPGVYEIRLTDAKYGGNIVVSDTLQGCFAVEANFQAMDRSTLEVVKSANKRIAEIGDAVAYTLDIRNTSTSASFTDITIVDELPVGFGYVGQSSRRGQERIQDPEGSRRIEWTLGDTLVPGSTLRLSYMTTIGSGAMEGDGTNRAVASARGPDGETVRSTVASAAVVVRPGVFTDHGIVIGKVFVDVNGNGLQEHGEEGLAGVELWLEDGTHVLTGDDGKYSLPDVRPGQHVIRIDARTLPVGSTVLAGGTEFAGDGMSRFVRLVESGVARADFRVMPPRQVLLQPFVTHVPSADLRTVVPGEGAVSAIVPASVAGDPAVSVPGAPDARDGRSTSRSGISSSATTSSPPEGGAIASGEVTGGSTLQATIIPATENGGSPAPGPDTAGVSTVGSTARGSIAPGAAAAPSATPTTTGSAAAVGSVAGRSSALGSPDALSPVPSRQRLERAGKEIHLKGMQPEERGHGEIGKTPDSIKLEDEHRAYPGLSRVSSKGIRQRDKADQSSVGTQRDGRCPQPGITAGIDDRLVQGERPSRETSAQRGTPKAPQSGYAIELVLAWISVQFVVLYLFHRWLHRKSKQPLMASAD